VKLTENQYNNFKDKYGESNANEMIEELGRYKALHGKTYKRDDIAIENWVAKKVMDRVKSTTTPTLPPPLKSLWITTNPTMGAIHETYHFLP
jgi:hypothetical protein